MKKTFLLGVLAFTVLGANGFAQKKGKKGTTAVAPVSAVTPTLKNENDSTLYLLGLSMANGLPAYLTSSGVLLDSAKVRADFMEREGATTLSASQQKNLNAELSAASVTNKNNLDGFIAGFVKTMTQGEDKAVKAFDAGVSLGNQMVGNVEMFTKEILPADAVVDKNIFIQAIVGHLSRAESLIPMDKVEEMLQTKVSGMYATRTQEKHGPAMETEAKFFAENKAKDGVIALPSGLQYKVLTQGTGEKPAESDNVKVHYKGTLLDGTVFDNSYDRGEPLTLGVGSVIQGWIEALQLMPVGSKWILYVPSDLGYGSRDMGQIPAYSTLIFEIELIEIVK